MEQVFRRVVLGILILVLSGTVLRSYQLQAAEVGQAVKLHLPGFSTSSLPFLIADDLGFYREEGIRVEFTRLPTAGGIQALVAGSLDASQIVGPTTLAAILSGAPLKVVTVFNDKPTFKLYAKKQFRSFADLKGAKLGSTTPGSTNDRLLKIVLEKNGLDWRKDLSLIYIGASDVMFKSLQAGAIDGGANPASNFLAEDLGFIRYLTSLAKSALCKAESPRAVSFSLRGTIRLIGFSGTLQGLKFFKAERAGR